MIFNGAEGNTNNLKTSPGRYAGEDNGWTAALFSAVLLDFDKTVMKYPSIQRFPGGASNDLIPDLQHPKNPVPALDINNLPKAVPSSD
jgi:arylsulfatase